MNAIGESQRDSVMQPRVARNELPWVAGQIVFNPNGVVTSARQKNCHNPVGVEYDFESKPKVAAGRQPWAGGRIAVGDEASNHQKFHA